MNWSNGFILFGILCNTAVNARSGSRRRIREYSAKIMSRPDHIPTAKCGEDIRLTCVAEGEPVPEIEWWYNGQTPDQSQKEIIRNLAREGRIRIKTEELYVVRSTLIIRDAEEIDEGIYQCRASNSRARRNKNINLYQHWKIEEVPLQKIMCKDTELTHTEIIPASKYNQSVFDDAVERAMTSFAVTTSTEDQHTNIPQSITPESPTSVNADEKITTSTTQPTSTTSSTVTSSSTHPKLQSFKTPDMKTHEAAKSTPRKSQKNVVKDNTDDQNENRLTRTSQQRISEERSAHRNSQEGCRNSGMGVNRENLTVRIFFIITSYIMASRWS